MDRILVFQEGRIVEEGTHAALMSFGGLYRDLVDRQGLGTVPGA
jgi:ABC-type multidrug transport system fused ATPase/permease subunit